MGQLPNFLLASPAVVMVLLHSYTFFSAHWDYVKRLGLVDNNLLGLPRKPCLLVRQYQVVTRFLMAGSPILPWLAAIMTTRMSKEPVPLAEDDNREVLMKIECRSNLRSNTDTILFQEKLESDKARWVMTFFLGCTLVGTILFCNHLPWT